MECEDRWAELHTYLLEEVVRRVDSFGNYVRLRAVCKSWRLRIPKNPIHIKNPWLVLPFEDEDETLRPFLNIGENKIHHFELSQTQNTTMFRGSYYGWLIAVNIDGTLQILNPFTGAQFDLPPLSTFPDVKSYEPDRLGEEYTLLDHDGGEYTLSKSQMQQSHALKIIISSSPDHDDSSFMAIAIYSAWRRLAYYKNGDNRWRDIPVTEIGCVYEDAIFHEGKIYAVNWKAQLYEYDMKTVLGGISKAQPPPGLAIIDTFDDPRYLVATPEGLLMIVRIITPVLNWNGEGPRRVFKTFGFQIYKLKTGEWSLVHSLENYVILLGHNSSLCTLADTFPNEKGNRIYFTDDYVDFQDFDSYGAHDIGYYDLKDRTFNGLLFSDSDIIKPYPTWLLH